MRTPERHADLRSALRRQLAVSVATMREMGMDDRDVRDATSQAQAALRLDEGASHALHATPLIEAIEAQVRLSELLMGELGLSDREIDHGTAPGREILDRWPGPGTCDGRDHASASESFERRTTLG